VVLVVGALLAAVLGPILFVAAAVVALVLAGAAYLYADRLVLRLSHARPVSPDEEPRYHNLIEGLCVSAGLPKPELYVVDDAAANSFATGRSPAHAAIVVTTGLLEKLSRMELEGVLAHELAHVRSNDILVTGLGTVLVALPLMPAGGLATRLLSALVGRGRESDADVAGVRLTRTRRVWRRRWRRSGGTGRPSPVSRAPPRTYGSGRPSTPTATTGAASSSPSASPRSGTCRPWSGFLRYAIGR